MSEIENPSSEHVETSGRRQDSVLVDQVADWLIRRALGESDLSTLMAGCCDRLYAAGIPIRRAHTAFRTLHPLLWAMGLRWERGEGVESLGFRHDESPELWQRTPHYFMMQSGIQSLRRRLVGPEALLDFDLLRELQVQGYTDYFAFVEAFDDAGQDGVVGSWATDRPSGFSDGDLRALARIQQRLAVAFKVAIREQIARNVVDAYLGPEAGRQVLNGYIQRGDHESIHAVIWYGDLRHSTHLSETISPAAYLGMLNSYFDCTAGAVLEEGGEVLLLLGDAVLAIFRTGGQDGDARSAAARALAAAEEAERRMRALNAGRAQRDEPVLEFGVGLHVGDVMYGNIGVPERLQFTVIGSAVNEVARLEGLTKELDRPLLVSRAFADLCPRPWSSLGSYPRPGVPEPLEVLAPAEEAGEVGA